MNGYPQVEGPEAADTPALAALIESLQRQHGAAVSAMLLYGSCLRSGDIFDGLLDVYLICDDYRSMYPGAFKSAANWLLPPNVFYAEVTVEDQVLRCKYSVISSADFRRGCSRRWFESYIWGRFAQPVKIVYCRDEQSRAQLEASLLMAVRTFLHRSLPLLPDSGSVNNLWQDSLAHSYATELRTERAGRANELAGSSRQFFLDVTRSVAADMSFPLRIDETADEPRYQARIAAWRRHLTRLAWGIRRVQGKLMSILRLLKALFTFEGGLDYIAWKLQRHSGREIVIPDRVRRYPLIFLWGFFWGLYREGVFK